MIVGTFYGAVSLHVKSIWDVALLHSIHNALAYFRMDSALDQQAHAAPLACIVALYCTLQINLNTHLGHAKPKEPEFGPWRAPLARMPGHGKADEVQTKPSSRLPPPRSPPCP